MKAYDYEAVVYEGEAFCVGCLPTWVSKAHDVTPIFASEEVDAYPVCAKCAREHDYMGLTTDGQLWKEARERAEKMVGEVEDLVDDNRHDGALEMMADEFGDVSLRTRVHLVLALCGLERREREAKHLPSNALLPKPLVAYWRLLVDEALAAAKAKLSADLYGRLFDCFS